MKEYERYKPYNIGFINNLIKGLSITNKLVTEINKSEAESVGLIALSRSSDPNLTLYKFRDCGHYEFLQPTHVRRDNIKCKTCLRIKEIKEANSIGYALLYKTKGSYRKYIKNCGHFTELLVSNIRNSKAEKCENCFYENLNNMAAKNDYRLVKNLGKGRWLLEFKQCNHQKDVHHQQVTRGNAVCRECLLNDHINCIENHGLTLKSLSDDRYAFYTLPCGHDKKLRMDHAVDGSWLCDSCGDNHYTKPSNVYLIRFTTPEFSWLKFGFSGQLDLRISNYGVPKDTKKEILEIVPFTNGYDAMKFEKQIHKKYKNVRYPKSKMKEYHSFNGFTECYPESFLTTLLDELKCMKGNR